MGEHRELPWLLRAGCAAALAASIVLPLTSCSLIGVAPTSVPTPTGTPTEVLDPSIPSADPSDSPEPTVTPTVAPSATPSATRSATPAPSTPPVASRNTVTPFITLADWDSSAKTLTVSAIVPKIVESGGTCTLTATRAGVSRTAGAPAVAVSTYTGCNPMTIPGSQLSSGTWNVVVSYSSAKSAGHSAGKTVQVER